jgi:pimeloyl-ACP methyl ester carboxylesterase
VLDDAVDDLHQLLVAAKVARPYILVGSSGGGFNVYQHAGRHPNEVAGLVMLDVPRGQAKMSAEDVKALAWDAPGNPETWTTSPSNGRWPCTASQFPRFLSL